MMSRRFFLAGGARPVAMAVVLALVAALPMVLRAVVVSPTAVFMSDGERSTQVTLFNSSPQPEEITMELRYGYPETDSTGAVVYRLIDSVSASDPSAARFVAIYPRRVLLAPGGRQVVRLVATPSANLPDGEYWGRFVIRSNPQTILAVTGADPGVRAGLQLEMRTVIPVLYRRGSVRTGVEIRSLTAETFADSVVVVRALLARQGNAAYLGNALLELRDSTGSVRASSRISIAIHPDQHRRFVLPVPVSHRGAKGLSVQLTLSADRGDLPASKILHAPPVTARTQVTSSS